MTNWLDNYEFELLNKPDQQTYYRSDNSIINLIFASKNLVNKLHIFWEISEQATGSDHIIIQFTIHIDNGNLVENPLYSNQYNFEKAD